MVTCGFNVGRPFNDDDPFDQELQRVANNVAVLLQKIYDRRDVPGMYGIANAAAGVAARMGLKLPSFMVPAIMPRTPEEIGAEVIAELNDNGLTL